jgi:hypothetical protein
LAESGKLTVQVPRLEEQMRRLESSLQRLYYAWVGGILFLGGILLLINGGTFGGALCLTLAILIFSWSLIRGAG